MTQQGNNGSFLLSEIAEEDVLQEIAIYEWLHDKKPSRSIIYRQLTANRGKEFTFDELPGDGEWVAPWVSNGNSSPEHTALLVEWALQQTIPVQEIIWDFLLDAERKLESTIEKLKGEGAIRSDFEPAKHKGLHVTDIMRNALPCTKEDLINLVKEVHPQAARPAKNVRSFLRRNNHRLLTDGEGIIHWSNDD